MTMFDQGPVRFEYPSDWEVSVEDTPAGWSVSVQTPRSAFWSLTLLDPDVSAADAVEATLAAYRDDYPSLDVEPLEEVGWLGVAAGVELDFLALDLVTTAHVRAFEAAQFTALLIVQGEDRDFADLLPQLDAITRSLRWTGTTADAEADHDVAESDASTNVDPDASHRADGNEQ
jgi:hypothetical protein